jgi:cysteine desulfurase
VEEAAKNLRANAEQMAAVRQRILSGLAGMPAIRFNLPRDPSCHILSLQVTPFRSEVLLHILSEQEIFVSSGSACSSHHGQSPVLKCFGLTDKERDCTVRLSFSALNTTEEADEFVKTLKEIVR